MKRAVPETVPPFFLALPLDGGGLGEGGGRRIETILREAVGRLRLRDHVLMRGTNTPSPNPFPIEGKGGGGVWRVSHSRRGP